MPEAEMKKDEKMAAAPESSLAAQREANAALGKRIQELERREQAREKEGAEMLFMQYQREGRFRVYAVEKTDPDGSRKAREFLQKGTSFFREVFGAIPPLVGNRPPTQTEVLPSAAKGANDGGLAQHNRALAAVKAKNFSMQSAEGKAEYNRLINQFSRE